METIRKPRIGLIGCFQSGKSTTINCFLKKRIAASGEGVAKTKRVVRYVYGENVEFAFIEQNGSRRIVDPKTFFDETTSETQDGSVGETTICSPILREVDLIDTPGFNACQEDVEATRAEIPNMDFVCLILDGTRGGFNEAERKVLQTLLEFDVPFVVLYNCRDLNAWSPDDALVALRIRALESSLTNVGTEPRVICGRRVFPVNLAWRWRALVAQGVDEETVFFGKTDTERLLERQITRYFQDAPSPKTLSAKSNFDWVYDYVNAPVNPIGVVKNSIPTPSLTIFFDELQATVSWSFVGANYSYEFATRKKEARFWSTFETRENETIVENLEEEREYEFRVRALSNDRRSVSPFCETICLKTPPRSARVTVDLGQGKKSLVRSF